MAGNLHDVALSLWRLAYGGDAKEFPEAQEKLARMVLRAKRQRVAPWPKLNHALANQVAREVLLCWWLRVCPSCEGRGYRTIPGTPTLSDCACPVCQGTGAVALEVHLLRTVGPGGVDPGRWLYGELGVLEALLARRMRQALA